MGFKEKEKSRKINISAVKKFKEIDICDYNNLKTQYNSLKTINENIVNNILLKNSVNKVFSNPNKKDKFTISIIGESTFMINKMIKKNMNLQLMIKPFCFLLLSFIMALVTTFMIFRYIEQQEINLKKTYKVEDLSEILNILLL